MTFLRYGIFLLLSASLAQPTTKKAEPAAEKKKDELDFATWEKINEKIGSSTKADRSWAVDEALRHSDSKVLTESTRLAMQDMLRERLQYETVPEIIEKIMGFLEARKARKDFFYILDFLKVTSHITFAKRAMNLLYGIHPPRLRYELDQMFVNDRGKIHSVTFLYAIEKPSKKDILWFAKAYRNYNLAHFWLTLPIQRDGLFLKSLALYLDDGLLLKQLDGAAIYWHLKYSHFVSTKPTAKIVNRAAFSHVISLPVKRQAEMLSLLSTYAPQKIKPEDFTNSGSTAARKWFASRYLAGKNSSTAWQGAFATMLRQEDKKLWVWPVSNYYKKLSDAEKKIWDVRCFGAKLPASLCLRSYLLAKPKMAWDFWSKLPAVKKTVSARQNLRRMITSKVIVRPEFIDWVLNHRQTRLRVRALWFLSEENYKRFAPLIASHWLAEKNSSVRTMLLGRVISSGALTDLYQPFVPDVNLAVAKYTLTIQEPVEEPVEGSGEAPGASEDDKKEEKPTSLQGNEPEQKADTKENEGGLVPDQPSGKQEQ